MKWCKRGVASAVLLIPNNSHQLSTGPPKWNSSVQVCTNISTIAFVTNFADEIALYDRQIRLWGTDTQLRLRSAKVLVINLGGLGTEIVKNLVLGGLNTIEIMDSHTVKEEDFAAQFFLPNDDSIVGQLKLPLVSAAIKELNTRVNLLINTKSFAEVEPDYYKNFDLVVATELTKDEILTLNELTRHRGIPLYVGGLHGMFGYILTDLIKHESVKLSERGNQPRKANTAINPVKTITNVEVDEKENKEIVTVLDEYVPLSEIFSSKKLPKQLNRRQLKRLSPALPLIMSLLGIDRPADPADDVDKALLKSVLAKVCKSLGLAESVITEEYLDAFSTQAFAEFAPVSAVLGGILAQDIIQYLGKKESPINNCLIFDAVQSELPIYYL